MGGGVSGEGKAGGEGEFSPMHGGAWCRGIDAVAKGESSQKQKAKCFERRRCDSRRGGASCFPKKTLPVYGKKGGRRIGRKRKTTNLRMKVIFEKKTLARKNCGLGGKRTVLLDWGRKKNIGPWKKKRVRKNSRTRSKRVEGEETPAMDRACFKDRASGKKKNHQKD